MSEVQIHHDPLSRQPRNIDHSWWPQTQAEEKIGKVLLANLSLADIKE